MIIHRVKGIKVHLSFVKNRRKDPSFNICEEEKAESPGMFITRLKLNYCSFQMKIENKLGLSWAKISHLNSIELRSTAVSRLSCSWKSQTELVCYKMCIFQQVKYKKADVKRIHIVDWNIYVIFINHLDHLKKIFHFFGCRFN